MQISPDGASIYTVPTGVMRKEFRKMQEELWSVSIIDEDEEIVGVVEKVFYGSMLQQLEELAKENSQGGCVVLVQFVEMYEIIAEMGLNALHKEKVMVCTKYKTGEKKEKPSTGPLATNSEQTRKEVSGDLTL